MGHSGASDGLGLSRHSEPEDFGGAGGLGAEKETNMTEERLQPNESTPQKPTIGQKLLAAIAGLIAVRIVAYVVTTMWRLVTREDPPQIDEAAPIAKKAAWVALIAAATGATRQAVNDVIKPSTTEPE